MEQVAVNALVTMGSKVVERIECRHVVWTKPLLTILRPLIHLRRAHQLALTFILNPAECPCVIRSKRLLISYRLHGFGTYIVGP